MKLYTEEEIHRTFGLILSKTFYDGLIGAMKPIELSSESICVNCDATKPIHKVCMDCIIKMGKENIELPSDEEINDEWEVGYSDYQDGCNYGAKWLRDKIK